MKDKTIIVDLDDVIRDFVPAVVKKYNELSGDNKKFYDIDKWDIIQCLPKIKNFEQFVKLYAVELMVFAEPIPDAIRSLDDLRKFNKVVIATHQFNGIEGHSYTWLSKNNVQYDSLFFGKDKYILRGDVMIDDKIRNLEKFSETNPDAKLYLMNRPWNQIPLDPKYNIERVNHISELLYK